ncbi:hypothetical protein MLD38_023324 [Melastoma candidum]|uniref:Uncharacterized protein n=1 Tax=Melastoma candidum TaxID=119954 RepID=A0ACB9QMA9_9MYRT|nr:hypothetical protein MLD38_023324 [Melastoma candidum]
MSEAAGHCYGNEPLTQAGWLFVQNETRQIIHWAMGFRNQIDFHRVKSFLQDSLVIKHPHWLHHAPGNGISLMSLLLMSCRRADDPGTMPTIGVSRRSDLRTGRRKGLVEVVMAVLSLVWWTVVYALEFIARSLRVKDTRTVIGGGEGVEPWLRRLRTASFRIDDTKAVKAAVSDAVRFFLDAPQISLYEMIIFFFLKEVMDGSKITGMLMVNLREQPGLQEFSVVMKGDPGLRWGNRFVVFLLPIKYRSGGSNGDPLDPLRRAKVMLDRKKGSLEAHFSYFIGNMVASILNYRIICNTTFTILNMIGPQEEITEMDNPITHFRVTTSSLPTALMMHMVSYAGRADMQILVAKDVIPEPRFLAKRFEEALLKMKAAATATTGPQAANRVR